MSELQSPVVAFVYIDTLKKLRPIYRACAQGLIDNVREVFGAAPVMVTDEKTEGFKGIDVVRVGRKCEVMTFRLAAQCVLHEVYDKILFTEPDVRFREPVWDVFEDKDFDVTVCDREQKTLLKGKEMPPITLGVNFSRSREFWKECTKHCMTLDRKAQLWGGDMEAVWHVIGTGAFKVKTLPAATYNHIPTGPIWDPDARVMHYKGTRKTWLFPALEEAA